MFAIQSYTLGWALWKLGPCLIPLQKALIILKPIPWGFTIVVRSKVLIIIVVNTFTIPNIKIP
jgi:hypothetical protein